MVINSILTVAVSPPSEVAFFSTHLDDGDVFKVVLKGYDAVSEKAKRPSRRRSSTPCERSRADLMASELDWDRPRTQREFAEVQARYPAWIRPDATEVNL
jgi:hypothetical protein